MSATVSNSSTQQLEQGQVKLWMVLVGVNHYQDSRIPNLRYCANDCKELAEALTIATQKFQETEIIALHDGGEKPPNKSEIINSIEKFSLAKPEDTVLFYFSGHGYLDFNNRPIFCVADTSLKYLAETGLKLDFLLKELRQCKAQRQLVWLDACQEREEQLHNRIRHNPTGQLLAVLEQQAQQSQDFYAMLSCNTDERSWEIPELKHGLFTYCLIEGLRGKAANNQGNIDADSLFRYVERSSSKFIKYKKNPLNEDSFSKGMLGSLKKSSTKLKVKRLPSNASQTPQRIAKGRGELIIGLATSCTKRKALIVDNLSSSEADISLCRILQGRGSFAVKYYFIKDKHQRSIQKIISSDLQDINNKNVLLYLAGSIEYTNSKTYELVFSSDTKINLNWLRQQLQDSPVQEIIVIADILETSGDTKNLIEILQPSSDKSLCLITASTSIPNSKKFLHQLVTILETAGESSREFWVSELITQLQEWRNSQPDFDLKLWLSGSTEVMEILSVEVQRSYDEIFEIDICPYKSLEAFTQDDAYFFHGREELIAEIIEKLQSTSFLAVVGASGSGKSSVVKAGVIPQLLTTGLFHFESEQFQPCQTWVMLPGDNPIAALAKALVPNNPDFLEGVLHLGVDSLVEWLNQQPLEISVLVIDQFEELFTLTAKTDRFNFLSLILDAIEKTRKTFKVIITLRSDFLDECLGMSELAPLITKSQVLVPSCRLEDKQYRQIIAQPAQKVGLEVEDGLIAILLGELKEGSLPLLQYALEELWHKRSRGKLTVKDYQQHIGKLGKFLSNKAQETYDNLSEAQKECAQSIFLSLVFLVKEQEDSNKDTRRRLPISDLLVDKYKNVLDSTLQALIEARLIVVSGEENNFSIVNQEQLNTSDDKENQQKSDLDLAASVEEETVSNQSKDKITVEIAHEILLRDWEALKWWLEKNREKYRLIREINQKADDWKHNGKGDGFLLSKGALGKYEEFYVNYADELSTVVHQFVKLSIEKRDFLKQQEEARRQKELEQERKALINAQRFTWTLFGGLVVSLGLTGIATWQSHNSRINEINSLSNTAEALLASNQELDALVTGLKAGKRIKNSFLEVDNRTKIKLIGGLQNIFYRVKEVNRLEGHTQWVEVVFSPDGQTIASASRDGTVKLWNQQGQLLYTLKSHTAPVTSVAFSPDGQTIASSSEDKTIKLWNLQGQLLHTLEGHTNDVVSVVFSPYGKIIASASATKDKTVKLWNLQGQLLHTLQGHKHYVVNVVFSPDGQTIASASYDGTIKLWNRQGQLLHTLESHTGAVDSVAFSPDGQTIASASSDKTIKLWNNQGQLIHTLKGHAGYVTSVVFSADGKMIASGSWDGTIKLWWNRQGRLLHTFRGHTGAVDSLVFSPDGQTIASAGSDGIVRLWNRQGRLLHTLRGHTGAVDSLVFSPDGQTIASAGSDGIVKLWNWQKRLLYTLEGHTYVEGGNYNLTEVVFSPDGQTIASASSDKTIKLWNNQGQLLQALDGHTGEIRSVVFSPNGQTIASASRDRTVKLWNRQGKLLQVLDGHTRTIDSLVFSPDSQTIASASADDTIDIPCVRGNYKNLKQRAKDNREWTLSSQSLIRSKCHTIKLWNRQGQLLQVFDGHTDKIRSIVFSPDGQTIASTSDDKTVKLWNLQGKLLYTFDSNTNKIRSVVFSPDGGSVASFGIDDTRVKLWNLNGQLLRTFKGHNGEVTSMAFSPDGKMIASASSDKTIKLWNLKGELLHTLKGHASYVYSIKFSSDGQIMASASDDKTIKLWNLKGELLHTLKGHADKVNSVVFSPYGKTLASASATKDKNVKLWSLDLDEVMKRGCNWARDYLTNNPNVSEEDRKICDGIGNE